MRYAALAPYYVRGYEGSVPLARRCAVCRSHLTLRTELRGWRAYTLVLSERRMQDCHRSLFVPEARNPRNPALRFACAGDKAPTWNLRAGGTLLCDPDK